MKDFHELCIPTVSECPMPSFEKQSTMATQMCSHKEIIIAAFICCQCAKYWNSDSFINSKKD